MRPSLDAGQVRQAVSCVPYASTRAATSATASSSACRQAAPIVAWIAGAKDGGTTRLGLGDAKLRAGEAVLFEYGYVHDAPRTLDTVFKFVYDPAILEPLPLQPGGGASGLAQEAGIRAPGEYWVRLSGEVPAGEGSIAAFPFRLRAGARAPKDLGRLTIYYPQ